MLGVLILLRRTTFLPKCISSSTPISSHVQCTEQLEQCVLPNGLLLDELADSVGVGRHWCRGEISGVLWEGARPLRHATVLQFTETKWGETGTS